MGALRPPTPFPSAPRRDQGQPSYRGWCGGNGTFHRKQYDSGGLTLDATGAENYCTILAISPSPLEKNVIWVGTDDGKIQIIKDGDGNWTDVTP